MADWTIVTLLAVLVALFAALLWSVWRHRVVEDLRAIRVLLERRARWEHELDEAIRELLRREARDE